MYVKHYPLNNYFVLDFTVMQCSVNKNVSLYFLRSFTNYFSFNIITNPHEILLFSLCIRSTIVGFKMTKHFKHRRRERQRQRRRRNRRRHENGLLEAVKPAQYDDNFPRRGLNREGAYHSPKITI